MFWLLGIQLNDSSIVLYSLCLLNNKVCLQIGCDLDITELLELYDYSKEEEERQIAHIVLLELVIDRFADKIMFFFCYLEDQILKQRNGK